MSITDELRTWMYGHTVNCSDDRIALVAIADRIDEAHKHAIAYVDDRDPETMAEHGWVKLPVDADGVPWYRGSRVIDPKDPDGKVNTVWIAGDNTLITDEHVFIFRANELRHYHAPTVEDVLTELEGMRGNGKTYEDVVMRCADLAGILRELLAGEDE